MLASTKKCLLLVLLCDLQSRLAHCFDFGTIDLPRNHLPFYFKTFPKIADECRNDDECPFKDYLDKDVCWGYEPNCPLEKAFQIPECPGDHKGWVKTKDAQINTFYSQADFGYLREHFKQIKIMCEPLFKEDSALECSDHLQFCRGRNIMINFTELSKEPGRYKMDVLKPGQIGGYCTFHESRLKQQIDHISPLQSWAPEMRNFEKLHQRPIENGLCDVVIENPTFILKIDAAVNMYHHFCDFFNLYGSLHLNSTHHEAFSRDVNIVIWETFSYHSSFASAFKAFSKHPILDLNEYRGKVVCFKSVVFPLLPRMIFGLFYNTPIIYGCEKSGLFKAFHEFMLHRLRVDNRDSESHNINHVDSDKIKVTFLSRRTAYRRVLNEKRLLKRLRSENRFLVREVEYNKDFPLRSQLESTQYSDIFIGMHGAGLTHLLFLPDWAVIFELYNCEDEHCYKDLARMRGVKYMTWRNSSALIQQDEGHHPEGGAHAKFTNYEFDADEFVKLVHEAADHVESHKKFKSYLQKIKTTAVEMAAEIELIDKVLKIETVTAIKSGTATYLGSGTETAGPDLESEDDESEGTDIGSSNESEDIDLGTDKNSTEKELGSSMDASNDNHDEL